jgi:hypothetical protein
MGPRKTGYYCRCIAARYFEAQQSFLPAEIGRQLLLILNLRLEVEDDGSL